MTYSVDERVDIFNFILEWFNIGGMKFNIANVSWRESCGVMRYVLNYKRATARVSFNVLTNLEDTKSRVKAGIRVRRF